MLVGHEGLWFRVLGKCWPELLLVFSVAAFVTAADVWLGWKWLLLSSTPLTIVGSTLGVMLGFRNNEAYNRYWEARTLWGAVVNDSRTLARLSLTLIQPHVATADRLQFARDMVTWQIAYVHALRFQLWRKQPFEHLAGVLSPADVDRLRVERNVPNAILQRLAEIVHFGWSKGWLHELHVPSFQNTVAGLTNSQGGCERIKNTPIPIFYTYTVHKLVVVFGCALPFGLLEPIGVLTPIVSILVAFAFILLEAFARSVEDPFCTTENGLPLLSITTTIEINLRQRLQEPQLPPEIGPHDGNLP